MEFDNHEITVLKVALEYWRHEIVDPGTPADREIDKLLVKLDEYRVPRLGEGVYCEECGKKYPDDATSMEGSWHGVSCSLNPVNVKPDQPISDKAWDALCESLADDALNMSDQEISEELKRMGVDVSDALEQLKAAIDRRREQKE